MSINASGKKRLILDLRYINQFIWKQRFRLDDWKIMMQYVHKGDFKFSFDLKSGYHHLDIFSGHQQYLGFSFRFGSRIRYFSFTVLCFGISSGPYIFSKLLRTLVKHWRGQGIKIAVFLDDGAGVNENFDTCLTHATQVKRDLECAGFVINYDKSIWTPCQGLVWLGLFWNLKEGMLEIPDSRLHKVETVISDIFNRLHGVSARKLAHLAGLIISLSPSLGNITQLMTRHIYFMINSRCNWDFPINISKCTELLSELNYWQNNVRQLSGSRKFDTASRIYPVTVFSDSSSVACAAYIKDQNEMVCHRMFTEEEKCLSSTARELMGIELAVHSFCNQFQNKEIQMCSDSQNAVRILRKGSRREHLHALAMSVFSVCLRFNIRLHLEWIPRSLNQQSDYLSRIIDLGDWQIADPFFKFINSLWGPVDIDRFASFNNAKVNRFNSRYWNPGTEAVNAFSQDWSHDINLLVPPTNLVARCLKHVLQCKARGILVTPAWQSASFWPILFQGKGVPSAMILDYKVMVNTGDIFVDGPPKNLFCMNKVKHVLIVNLDASKLEV